jgi:hypothetical protein
MQSSLSVVQDWPEAGTNCRSSMQIGHAPGRASEGGYCVPQAVQMKAGMRLGYTRVAVDDHVLLVNPVKRRVARRRDVAFGSKRRNPRTSYYVSYSIEKWTGQHDWLVSLPNRLTDSLVDTIFNIFASPAWPAVPSVVKFLGQGLLCFWHRFDQQRERLAEA